MRTRLRILLLSLAFSFARAEVVVASISTTNSATLEASNSSKETISVADPKKELIQKSEQLLKMNSDLIENLKKGLKSEKITHENVPGNTQSQQQKGFTMPATEKNAANGTVPTLSKKTPIILAIPKVPLKRAEDKEAGESSPTRNLDKVSDLLTKLLKNEGESKKALIGTLDKVSDMLAQILKSTEESKKAILASLDQASDLLTQKMKVTDEKSKKMPPAPIIKPVEKEIARKPEALKANTKYHIIEVTEKKK